MVNELDVGISVQADNDRAVEFGILDEPLSLRDCVGEP
jgi:hypothetical protein